MNRREAITAVSWLLGGTIVGADLLVACTSKPAQVNELFDIDQVTFLDEVAETILPATSTPGAKAAKVGDFMAVMVKDCYTPEDQAVFLKGISQLDEISNKKYSKKFMKLDKSQRTALLTTLDAEQKAYMAEKKEGEPSHYFRMMKELTLLGFFTSEVGATQALRYVAVPGRYDGNAPYKKGERAWAT
ncbi:gluconate 2-dehydrogenase subunit 3-like protein [Pontibacter ummariensis]|uniref:Gluconate 2-dehydrogenase subunit 3 n=1 Tax=Pontibacter ummariensis TaxID=1610492 RepID=A0A239C2W8_9BACT|nr:gluconate 2-dehydrogenase subunit 3 family protein [Pontibacter ummariensis]PRY15500.1 gluconate 2-dehydrogenase subunit 3-like protein [Pontibacter ummariensis]SNS14008.1 Gluconate 2-dehydrogenase subunit 3 [Pontibacter ummariensis]